MRSLLAQGAVDVWVFEPCDCLTRDAAWQIIGQEERMRAQRFRSEEERHFFMCGHAVVRQILARHTDEDPGELRFLRGQYGKPRLEGAGGNLHFNWSHAGRLWGLAISRTGPLGIDIEVSRRSLDWKGPAEIAFHPGERGFVERASGSRTRAFYSLWVRKEALFKGMGTGLHNDMALTSIVEPTDRMKDAVVMPDGIPWCVRDLSVPSGYAAALATSFCPREVRELDAADLGVAVSAERDCSPIRPRGERRIAEVRG